MYPVISRRSRGLSIGVNLNPDTACNFNCVYCQVDRTVEPRTRRVDVDILGTELGHMINHAQSGGLFDEPQFAGVPQEMRVVRDIAFSGDGEPTTCPVFGAAVEMAQAFKKQAGLPDVKTVLITDACYLTKPAVWAALETMHADGQGEIWAKLDAGTEDYYQQINKPNHPLAHVMENIITAAKQWPLVIQAMFLRLDGAGPSPAEVTAFAGRLKNVVAAGGAIKYVQVYTVARPPAVSVVTPLSNDEVDDIVSRVREEAGLEAEPFYGMGS